MLEIGSSPDFRFTVARTSKSPFPLSAILSLDHTNMKQLKIIKNQPKIYYTQKEIDYIERNKSTNIDFDYFS